MKSYREFINEASEPRYKLTDVTAKVDGVTVYQIVALKAFKTHNTTVKAGELGGYIESEKNLEQKSNAWVFDLAIFGVGDFVAAIYGKAKVYGNAEIGGTVYGNAKVYGNVTTMYPASVYGNAKVYGNAFVGEKSQVYDNAKVYGDAVVRGINKVYGDAAVYGKAKIKGGGNDFKTPAEIYGKGKVYGNALVGSTAHVYGKGEVGGTAELVGPAPVYAVHDKKVLKGYYRVWDEGRTFKVVGGEFVPMDYEPQFGTKEGI